MMLTVAVTLCHLVSPAAPGVSGQEDTPSGLDIHPRKHIVQTDLMSICHEEVIFQGEGSMQMCLLPQAAIADWKDKSRFSGPAWTVKKIRCVPGKAEPRGNI